MASGHYTLDYLLEVIHEIHESRYVVFSQFPNRSEVQRILTGLHRCGIVRKSTTVPVKLRHYSWMGVGRPPMIYSLAVPYSSIKLGDVYPLAGELSGIKLRLCQLGKDIPLHTLHKTKTLRVSDIKSRYTPTILLNGLSMLSQNNWRQYDKKDNTGVSWGDRQWSSDMVSEGIVENKYGEGYKLIVPLTKVKIAKILPYLCYLSPRQQTYNRLFHLLNQRPVSILLPPYEEAM